jgi:hypothetical protein
MTITVNGPNGVTINFPDGTDEKTISSVMQQAITGKAAEKSSAPDKGGADAFARGTAQGLSAGFYDELRGLVEAGGAKANDPASLYKMLSGAYKYWTGDKAAEKQYNETAKRERELTKTAEEQHPVASIGGNILGGIALPVGATANAATLPARMGRGAAVGAGYGALSGVGEGEGAADSLSRGATGLALGGALGGAAPAVFEGALQLGRHTLNPVISNIRGVRDPDGEAARRVVESLRRDVDTDPNALTRLTPQEFANTPQASIIDVGGETTRALARSAANTSPEGRMALSGRLDDRYYTQSDRFVNWLNRSFNYPDAAARQEALENVARTTNRAAYTRAYREGADGLWSPELERLAGSDAVVAAMQRAASKSRDESIVSGYGAMNPRITFSPSGVMQFNRAPNGMPTYPDLQYWDLVRRELSDEAQRAGRGTSDARRLESFARSMNAELDRLVPSYQAARQGAAAAFGAENALEAGQNFVTHRMGNRDAMRELARMTPQERQLFQDGFISRYVDSLRETGDARNILNKIGESPAARERLTMVLGQQRATELEAMLRIEGIMNLPRQAVQGNSTTARQLAELGLAGGAVSYGGISTYNMDPANMTAAAVVGALVAGRRHIDQRVAQRVAEMLVSRDPDVFRRGVQTVARNQRMMDALRSTDKRLASVGGQQTPVGIPALQGPSVSRAEEGEPEVPRPPGY